MKILPLIKLLVAALIFVAMPLMGQGFTDAEIASSADMKELDSPPKPVKQSAPDVPAKLRGVQASVQVGFLIDEAGKVTAPRIIKSSNDEVNDVAMKCVETWQFEPGKRGGQPVQVRVIVPLRFK